MLPSSFLHPDHQRLSIIAYAFLFLISWACFTPGLVSLPPTDRDESLYAQASKQMIETGNFIDIRYQDQPRYKKPIGIYWAQVAAIKIANPDHLDEIWAYRLPSLVGATLSVLLTAAIGALLFTPATGFYAALMLASCLLLNVEARLAKTDAALLATTLSMIYGLARAYKLPRPTSWLSFFAFWLGLGTSLLIKGPIALIILFGILLWLRVAEKSISWTTRLRPRIGIPLFLLTTLPWFVTIVMQSNGAFLHESAGQDLLQKIWQGQGGFRPPGMHAAIIPLLFFPASLFILLAIPDAWRNRTNPAVSFCLGWIIPFWTVFELTFTKLPHYVLPAYPALALLASKALIDGYPALQLNTRSRILWPTFSVIIWLLVGSSLAVGSVLLPRMMGQSGVDYAQIISGLLLLLIMGCILLLLLHRREHAVPLSTIGGMIFLGISIGHMLPKVPHLWLSQDIQFGARTSPINCAPHILASGYSEPSLAFLMGTNTRFLNSSSAAADMFMKDPCPLAVLSNDRAVDFVELVHKQGAAPQALAEVAGYNMGTGRMTTLQLYRK